MSKNMARAFKVIDVLDKLVGTERLNKATANIFSFGGLLFSNETPHERAEREAAAERKKRHDEWLAEQERDRLEHERREAERARLEAYYKTPEGKAELASRKAGRARIVTEEILERTGEKAEWERINKPLFDPDLEAEDLNREERGDEPIQAIANRYMMRPLMALSFESMRKTRIATRARVREQAKVVSRWIGAGGLALVFASCGTTAVVLSQSGGAPKAVPVVSTISDPKPPGPVRPPGGPVAPPGGAVTASAGALPPSAGAKASPVPVQPAPSPVPVRPPTKALATPAVAPTAGPSASPRPSPTRFTATGRYRYACYERTDYGPSGDVEIVFASDRTPGKPTSITLSSDVAPTTRKATSTVLPNGDLEFYVPVSQPKETLKVTSLVVDGVQGDHDFGTYLTPATSDGC